MRKQARPPIFSLWFKARRKVKPHLPALCSGLYTSCKNMATSTDFSHGCVLEVASKNDFKTCRNCQALRKCLLKTHKIVQIETKTASHLFSGCFKEVALVFSPPGLGCAELRQEKQAWPRFHNRALKRDKQPFNIPEVTPRGGATSTLCYSNSRFSRRIKHSANTLPRQRPWSR